MANLTGFDLNLLRVLDALLRDRSTVRAGDRLGLSQPAVSAALGRLRHALSDPLFVRQGQGMTPTAFAEALEQPLRQTLDRIEAMLRRQADFDPSVASFDFCLSGSDYFAVTLMPELTRRVSEVAPGVRLKLVELAPQNYIEPLMGHDVDLVLVPVEPFPAWTESAPLFASDFVVIARNGHSALAGVPEGKSIPLDVFCSLDHVLCSPEGRWRAFGDAALAKVGRKRRVTVSVSFFHAVLSIVAGSDLIALIPRKLTSLPGTRELLTSYLPPVPLSPPELCMVWHRRRTGDAAHAWMRGLVNDIVAP